MLKGSRVPIDSIRKHVFIRCNTSFTKLSGYIDSGEHTIDISKSLSLEVSTLPFAYRKESEAFGQLVKGNNSEQQLNPPLEPRVVVIPREEYLEKLTRATSQDEKTRTQNRLDPKTERGKFSTHQAKIPNEIVNAIQNHIASQHLPKLLKRAASDMYVKLREEELHSPTENAMQVDGHIAAFFVQNYASIYQSLEELKKRNPDFNPKKVLDIGFGPATGMVALNDLMGDKFKPDVKDAVIIGHHEMQERAKIILSRQINEYVGDIEELEEISENETAEFVGAVMTRHIETRTRLQNHLVKGRKYDLIIATHQLLQNAQNFPSEVDLSVESLLKSLEPGGHLVLVERGNPLGFEAIARARQVMIRPENYADESGKIPRPWIRGSQIKPQKVDMKDRRSRDQDFLKEIESKFGNVSKKDLQFEEEVLADMEIVQDRGGDNHVSSDYHLSVIAPCSHHKKCPLQTLNPKFYSYPEGKKKLQWCRFQKSVERPLFTQELKRGKILGMKWNSSTTGEATEKVKPGSGRENGNNFEIATYSYLIVHRSENDMATINQIEKERKLAKADSKSIDISQWPRVLYAPMKRKGHVVFGVCSPSGDVEKWTITKSFSNNAYHDARKASAGDLWPLGAKSKTASSWNVSDEMTNRLQEYERSQKKLNKKQSKKLYKEREHKVKEAEREMVNADCGDFEKVLQVYADTFELSNNESQKGKKELTKSQKKLKI